MVGNQAGKNCDLATQGALAAASDQLWKSAYHKSIRISMMHWGHENSGKI